MQLSLKVFLYFAFMAIALISKVNCNCPSQKTSRSIQRKHLQRLEEDEIVVEALYYGKYKAYYWFIIQQVWTRNNGNLERYNNVYVDSSSVSFGECFKLLNWKPSYILMLRKAEMQKAVYHIITPPVLSGRKKFRQLIWNHLCPAPGSDSSSCKMRITLPEKVTYFEGGISQLECKIESSTPIANVVWFKDDTQIQTDLRVNVIIDNSSKDASILTFNKANQMHKGEYVCSARNDGGERQSASTRVEVVGLNTRSLDECENPYLCANGGTCQKLSNGAERCECPKTFKGPRCQIKSIIDDRVSASEVIEHNEHDRMRSSISTLTTAVTALAIILFFVLCFSLIYINSLRRRIKAKRNHYGNEEEHFELTQKTSRELASPYYKRDNESAKVQIKVSKPSHPIEFPPSRSPSIRENNLSLYSLNSQVPSEGSLAMTQSNKGSNQNVFLQVPCNGSISFKSGSPNAVRRERLKANSFS